MKGQILGTWKFRNFVISLDNLPMINDDFLILDHKKMCVSQHIDHMGWVPLKHTLSCVPNLEHKASCVSKMFHSSITPHFRPWVRQKSIGSVSDNFGSASDPTNHNFFASARMSVGQTNKFCPNVHPWSESDHPTQPEFARNDSL